jgi:hypothetical protein
MINNETSIEQIKPGSGLGSINKQRRTFIGGAVAALLASSRRLIADDEGAPNDPFILLLHGIYQPVPLNQGPKSNLGLTTVNLSDGSYSVTQIYPIFGVDGANDQKKPIGNFYVSLQTSLCAYQLPGGSIATQFTGGQFLNDYPGWERWAVRRRNFRANYT